MDWREAWRAGLAAGVVVGAGIVFFVLALLSPAGATWRAEYAQAPRAVQDWYGAAELTAAAQKRFPYKKCCDHADVVKTKFRVNRVDGADEWDYLKDGVWTRIPPDIIHWGESAPGGEPTLFVYAGRETCFFPGQGGL